jgi:chromosome segregation ATPase
MFTRLRRCCLSYLDAELATSVGELADLQREIVARDDRLAACQHRIAELESSHAQVAAVLTAERDSARHDIEQLAIELANVRHELDKTSKALAVAEEENRRLWAVCQRDHARVAKERALLDRARAEAETAASVGQAEE